MNQYIITDKQSGLVSIRSIALQTVKSHQEESVSDSDYFN